MSKFGLLLIVAVCSFSSVFADTCTRDATKAFEKISFVDMRPACVKQTEKQIETEITASLKYLSMAAHFSKDTVNRPGFAKLFFDAASEEREHAYKLIEYLSMRGSLNTTGEIPRIDISRLVKESGSLTVSNVQLTNLKLSNDDKTTTSGLIALQNALKLEVFVTESIRKLVKICEDEQFNHYHFVDYLTGEFLDEQYKGQRDLAGKISTLSKMVNTQGGSELADFLFDKQLL